MTGIVTPVSMLDMFPSVRVLLSLKMVEFKLSDMFSTSKFSMYGIVRFPSPGIASFFEPLGSELVNYTFSSALTALAVWIYIFSSRATLTGDPF